MELIFQSGPIPKTALFHCAYYIILTGRDTLLRTLLVITHSSSGGKDYILHLTDEKLRPGDVK